MKPTCDRAKVYPPCIEDGSGGACPPFTCREKGLGFGAWWGWRADTDGSHDDPRGVIERTVEVDEGAYRIEVQPFELVERMRCTRVTRSRRPARSQRKKAAAAIPQPRRKIKA